MSSSPKRTTFPRSTMFFPRRTIARSFHAIRRPMLIVVVLSIAFFLAGIVQDLLGLSSGDSTSTSTSGSSTSSSGGSINSRIVRKGGMKGTMMNDVINKLSSSSESSKDPDGLGVGLLKKATVTLTKTVTETKTSWVASSVGPAVFKPGGASGHGTGYDEDNDDDDDDNVHDNLDEKGGYVLGEHSYRPDGLLEVNPKGAHPIFELMKRAEEEWEEKHRRASKTLGEACREYERRYGRVPPKGFDIWWSYAQKHSIQLPDEYDQIHRDLEPFWGVRPSDLQSIQKDWETHQDSYTLGKLEQPSSSEIQGEFVPYGGTYTNPMQIVNYSFRGDDNQRQEFAIGAFTILELLEEVEHYIPPFRAVFSPHDNPNLPIDWELRDLAIQAANKGEYIDIHNPPELKLHGWASSCPPFSPAWKDPIPYPSDPPTFPTPLIPPPSPSKPKTFIHNHRSSMDPCLHPSHLLTHGQFLSHGVGPVPHRTLIPQFSYSPTLLHQDIMAAVPLNWVEDVLPREDDPEWEEKEDGRVQWRGKNTGIWHGDKMVWWEGQRGRLIKWANGHDVGNGEGKVEVGNWTVLRSRGPRGRKRGKKNNKKKDLKGASGSGDDKIDLSSYPDAHRPVGAPKPVPSSLWAPAMFDIAYASSPINCLPTICNTLSAIYEFRKPQSFKTQGRYQYIIDVDGNGWSSRFKRLMTSNALIFKSTIYPEWWLDRVMPWKHYVPVQNDLSDLWDVVHFFRGDEGGRGAHEGLAGKIARGGREWSKGYWRKEDMVGYMFRLFLEYARVMSEDREGMGYYYVPREGEVIREREREEKDEDEGDNEEDWVGVEVDTPEDDDLLDGEDEDIVYGVEELEGDGDGW